MKPFSPRVYAEVSPVGKFRIWLPFGCGLAFMCVVDVVYYFFADEMMVIFFGNSNFSQAKRDWFGGGFWVGPEPPTGGQTRRSVPVRTRSTLWFSSRTCLPEYVTPFRGLRACRGRWCRLLRRWPTPPSPQDIFRVRLHAFHLHWEHFADSEEAVPRGRCTLTNKVL